jgi:hypothetical protein
MFTSSFHPIEDREWEQKHFWSTKNRLQPKNISRIFTEIREIKQELFRHASFEVLISLKPFFGYDVSRYLISLLPDSDVWRLALTRKTEALATLFCVNKEISEYYSFEKKDTVVRNVEVLKLIPLTVSENPPMFEEWWIGADMNKSPGKLLPVGRIILNGSISAILQKEWKKIKNMEYTPEYLNTFHGIFYDILERMVASGAWTHKKEQLVRFLIFFIF